MLFGRYRIAYIPDQLTVLLAGWLIFVCAALAGGQEPPRDELYGELAEAAQGLEQQSSLLKKLVLVVRPTVVHIEAEKKAGSNVRYDTSRTVEEAGSGVIIQRKGQNYVLTNRHVICHAALDKIKIRLADGREINPTRVWSDAGTDVGVMAVAEPGIVASRLGDSDQIEIGDFVVAVGSPFGLSHSVTYGIISAKGRRDLELGAEGVRYQNFLQTDAAINPGNSGGPLVNLRGQVVGINTAIASNSGGNEGIGFTIPINMVMIIADQLVETGTVVRAFLGVHLDSKYAQAKAVELGLPSARGARVTGVTAGSPAEQAELQVDDVIVEFNSVSVDDDNHLVNLVSLTPVDKEVQLKIIRKGHPQSIRIKVTNRSRFDPPS